METQKTVTIDGVDYTIRKLSWSAAMSSPALQRFFGFGSVIVGEEVETDFEDDADAPTPVTVKDALTDRELVEAVLTSCVEPFDGDSVDPVTALILFGEAWALNGFADIGERLRRFRIPRAGEGDAGDGGA